MRCLLPGGYLMLILNRIIAFDVAASTSVRGCSFLYFFEKIDLRTIFCDSYSLYRVERDNGIEMNFAND